MLLCYVLELALRVRTGMQSGAFSHNQRKIEATVFTLHASCTRPTEDCHPAIVAARLSGIIFGMLDA